MTILVGVAGGAVATAGTAMIEAVAMLPLPDAHGFAGCFAGISKGRLLVAGGANFPDGVMPWDGGRKVWHSGVFALELAHPEAGWMRVGELSEVAGYGISLALDDAILLVGGGAAASHFRSTRLMRWVDGKVVFKELAPLPIALANACGAVVEGKAHVMGGTEEPDVTVASARHFVLDLLTGWSELPPLPGEGLMLATAAALDGDLIVAGGCSLHAGPDGKPVRTYQRKAWKFAGGKWTAIAELPRAAVGAATPGWRCGGKMVIAGGDDGTQAGGDPRAHTGFCRDLLAYDSRSDRWAVWAQVAEGLPVTLPGVETDGELILVSGEIRPGVRTPRVTRLLVPKQ